MLTLGPAPADDPAPCASCLPLCCAPPIPRRSFVTLHPDLHPDKQAVHKHLAAKELAHYDR